ncbi:hypothetical protein, partial [Cohnella fermenti]|uniref:hypothetical protein n=1 Tax=Cohnella fermenti TaxID=2565925 RepID=UPI001B3B1C09
SVTANLTCPAIDDDSCPRFNGNSDREPYANGKAEFGFPVHFRLQLDKYLSYAGKIAPLA